MNGTGAPHEFGIYVGVGSSPTFSQVGSDFNFDPANDSGTLQNDPKVLLDVTASGLNINAAAGDDVEIRLYAWGASAGNGNAHIIGAKVESAASLPPAIPEPATLSLICLAGAALLRRRR